MKANAYRQCILRKTEAGRTKEQTAWIPEEFATLGGVVKLKSSHGDWVDGWIVHAVGARKSAKDVQSDSQAWKRTRKHSDVAHGTFKKEETTEKGDTC